MNKDTESSSSSGDLFEYPMKEKVWLGDKRPEREKKVQSEEDTSLKGPGKKNPDTLPPQKLFYFEENSGDDENVMYKDDTWIAESISGKVESKNESKKEVDVISIDRQDQPLHIELTPVPTI